MCRLAFRRDPSKVCCPLACLSLCFVQAHGYWSCAGCPSVVSACLSLWYVQACVYHSCAECLLVLSVPAHDADAVLCAPMFDLYKLVSADAVLYALCFSVCKSMSPLLCCGGHDKLQLPLVCGITGLQHAAMLPFATSAITHAGAVDQKLQWQCLFGTHLQTSHLHMQQSFLICVCTGPLQASQAHAYKRALVLQCIPPIMSVLM